MKKAFLIALVVPLFFIAFCGVAFADTYTVNVLGESYTFDTGNGADGDVVLRLKPGNPSVAELLVNGTLKATTSSTTTIKKNVLEKNGGPLNSRSDITVRVFNIEDIVQYLPVNKTYDPSNDTPGSGSMPSLNNLTVENGVMLRAATKPLHFRVKGTLTVNGYLMSQHGSAGTAGGYQKPGNPGGSAKNIIILAGSVVVNNGYNSAIFGGFGGGGGGSGWYGGSGGNGGDGGSVTIYCNNLTNTGEIHGGSGGGGGVAFSDYSPGGQGGKGGSVLIVANNFNNTGKIMSGMYGGDGTQSEYLPAYGGYGAGGNLYSNGGTGGDPGGSVYGPPNYPQSGAGFGVEGTSSNLHSSNNCGSLRILVGGSYINSGKFGIGYSSVNIPYIWNYRGLVEIKTNIVLGELDPAAILTHIMNNTRYLFPNLNHLVFQNFYQNNFRLSFVAKNISVKDTISVDNGSFVFGDRNITDAINFAAPFYTAYSYGNSMHDMRLNARKLIKITGNLPGYVGDSFVINDEWKLATNLYYPYTPFSGSPISAYPDSNGMLALDLTAYSNAYSNYNYTLNFVLLRSEDGGNTWEELQPVDIVCTKGTSPKIVDLKTKVNKSILYKVKHKKSGSPYGYVMFEVTTEGYTSAAPLAEAKESAQTAAANAQNAANNTWKDGYSAAQWAEWAANNTWYGPESKTVAQVAAEARDKANQALTAINNLQNNMTPVLLKVSGYNGATCTTSNTFNVVVQAPGATEFRVKADTGSWSAWTPVGGYATATGITGTGAHTIFVEARNSAGTVTSGQMTVFKLQ